MRSLYLKYVAHSGEKSSIFQKRDKEPVTDDTCRSTLALHNLTSNISYVPEYIITLQNVLSYEKEAIGKQPYWIPQATKAHNYSGSSRIVWWG